LKVGHQDTKQLQRRPRPGDKRHLDEVLLTINKGRHYLWWAVDQDGNVLDILVQRRRDKKAAKREILPGMEHRQHRSLNNRAENSHQPTRQREQRLQRFKSPGHAQRFLSAYGPIASHFQPRRHLLPAPEYHQEMTQRFQL
jgi:putative transposase